MSLGRQILSNTIVQIVGRGVIVATGLLLVAALTRYLGVAGYGDYVTVVGYVAFAEVFSSFGLYWILLRAISRAPDDEARFINNVVTFRALISVVVLTLAALGAWLVPQYSFEVRIGIVLLSVAWLWTSLTATYSAVFQRHLRMDRAVLAELAGRLVILAGILWGITLQANFLSLLAWYIVGNALTFGLSVWLGRRLVRLRPRFELALWSQLWRQALPMGAVLVLHAVYFKVDSVMLPLLKSTVDVGIYGAAYKIIEVILTLPVIFLGNLFPTLAVYLERRDARVAALFQIAFDVLAMVALPLIGVTLFFAQPLLALITGTEFVAASTVALWGYPATAATTLSILMVAAGIGFVSVLCNYVLLALGRQQALILPNLLFVVLNVVGNLLLIPTLSYIGAALATVLTEFVVAGVLLWLVTVQTGLRPHWRTFWRIAGATAVMSGMILLVGAGTLWLQVAAAAISYGLGLWVFGAIGHDMQSYIQKRGVDEGSD